MEGGTAHGQEYDHVDQLVSLGVPRASVYKGSKGGLAGQGGHARRVLLPLGVGFPPPPNPSWNRIHGGGERERGGRPPLLVLIGLGEGGRHTAILGCPFLLSTKAH